MGGQLSCVSCKNRKETNSTAKTKKKVESQPTESNVITSNAKYCPVTSGWELYQILQTNNGWVRKGEEKLSDVEKVAKAIVEINVYLASQVIFPALERYIRENQQKSDEDKEEEDNEDKEEEDNEKKNEENKQRFSNLPHNKSKSSS